MCIVQLHIIFSLSRLRRLIDWVSVETTEKSKCLASRALSNDSWQPDDDSSKWMTLDRLMEKLKCIYTLSQSRNFRWSPQFLSSSLEFWRTGSVSYLVTCRFLKRDKKYKKKKVHCHPPLPPSFLAYASFVYQVRFFTFWCWSLAGPLEAGGRQWGFRRVSNKNLFNSCKQCAFLHAWFATSTLGRASFAGAVSTSLCMTFGVCSVSSSLYHMTNHWSP